MPLDTLFKEYVRNLRASSGHPARIAAAAMAGARCRALGLRAVWWYRSGAPARPSVSEDFDFFSSTGFDPDRLRSRLPFFRDLDPADPNAWVQRKRDNLEAFVDRGGLVKLAFFGGLDTLGRIEDPRRAAGSRVQVASLIDLAGMKMRVIQVRGSWKDYIDIHTLAVNGVDIPTGLAVAKAIDRNFDPGISIRALQFYGDGTLDRVPAGIERDLTRWAQEVDLGKLPTLPCKRGLSPGELER
jgi:hypothetical protein